MMKVNIQKSKPKKKRKKGKVYPPFKFVQLKNKKTQFVNKIQTHIMKARPLSSTTLQERTFLFYLNHALMGKRRKTFKKIIPLWG